MKRKGISPLIAAVLLIAFTMAVASLFAQWAPQLIKSAQGDTKNQSQQIQRCSGLGIEIVQADLSSTPASITIQQTRGDSAIGNLSVTWFYSSGPIQNYTMVSSPRDTSVVDGDGSGGSISEVQVTPVNCQGAAPVTYTP
ncbi:MAG: archaellin/type IV pilin N-terminal domain-containing protein [Candidatus Nanohaloarchaea archaeon]